MIKCYIIYEYTYISNNIEYQLHLYLLNTFILNNNKYYQHYLKENILYF